MFNAYMYNVDFDPIFDFIQQSHKYQNYKFKKQLIN